MTFIWGGMLWLLVAIPLLAALYVWLLRRRRRQALRYANLAIVKQALGRGPGWRRHVPPVLMGLALTALIVAVARPTALVTLAASRATIILAMDVSGSMRAADVLPSRLEASQAAAKQFISEVPPDMQIGVVAFAGQAMLVQAPTIDHDALITAIEGFDLRRGTAVGSGLLVSLATIFPDENFDPQGRGDLRDSLGLPSFGAYGIGGTSRALDDRSSRIDASAHVPVAPGSYENAVVILLTDGATTTGPNPLLVGKIAADHGVRVFTVGFGSERGEVIDFGGRSMRAQLDSATLEAIADTTKAQYFQAGSADDLTQVYNSLSTRLISERKVTEIAFIFAGVGALFALLGAGLSIFWFGRVL
jgi:Ca-activated chloride channel family protein